MGDDRGVGSVNGAEMVRQGLPEGLRRRGSGVVRRTGDPHTASVAAIIFGWSAGCHRQVFLAGVRAGIVTAILLGIAAI